MSCSYIYIKLKTYKCDVVTYFCNLLVVATFVLYITGGGLDVDEAISGDIAWFNIWDYRMSRSQLDDLTALSVGNVASMKTLKAAGNVHEYMIDFPPNSKVYRE